jgi:DNA-binding MarR family transcriptional regulator
MPRKTDPRSARDHGAEPGATGSATATDFEHEFDHESVARLRAAIGKISRRLRPTAAGSELTPSQISVLFTVVRLGPLGLSELAEIEAINPTMLSRITGDLADAGLLRRESRPEDRRAATVTATALGRRLRERVHNERTRALSEYLGDLGEDERAALLAALPALEELAARVGERRQ